MIMRDSFILRGMTNMYNALTFSQSVLCMRQSLSEWQIWFDPIEYHQFSEPMKYMVENYLMGGDLITKKAGQFIKGFDSQIAQRVNGGSFFSGTDFGLQEVVTPVFNDRMGLMSQQITSLYSGQGEAKDVGIVRY